MTRTHGIDVEPFHQPNILDHRFDGDYSSRNRIMFVTVHTSDGNRDTVYQKLSVLDFDLSKTDFTGYGFRRLARGVRQRNQQRIQMGLLCRPFLRPWDNRFEGNRDFLRRLNPEFFSLFEDRRMRFFVFDEFDQESVLARLFGQGVIDAYIQSE